MDYPLLLSTLYDRAVMLFADREIVSVEADGSRHRTTYGQTDDRVRRLASALGRFGVGRGGVVGTFGWNTHRHHELYWATANTGRVCHTLNIRLFPEQLTYIINHAEDEVLFVDATLAPLIAPIQHELPTVRHWVVMDGDPAASGIDGAVGYEELLAESEPTGHWPSVDERSPMMFCYTSGTTGNPKGVAYTQRSTYMHTITNMGSLGMTGADNLLPIVPMFHAAAWGMPFIATTVGAKITYPGADLTPAGLVPLFVDEHVTFSAGVPTVFLGMQQYLMDHPDQRLPEDLRLVCGGSAVPRGLMAWYLEHQGIRIDQAWGMTETNPVASVAMLRPEMLEWPIERQLDVMETVGVPMPGLRMKIVDDEGNELPHDGEAFGELLIQGPWIAAEYFRDDRQEAFVDGWMRTGDVCTISPDGYVRITDRAKDVIKSGGEWISSLDLENTIMAHPSVAEAVVVGVRHDQWQERPVAFVVPRPGQQPTEEEILGYLGPLVAKWWLPDKVVFIDEIPKTGTGKFDKKVIRAEYETILLD
jgi:fatty-acyl-CoA synthase